ncbi:MAG: alanine dehydrogenase [Clostridiales bacterium]|nr:alanine dehydrogenase [Clostridiales bacterium]
MIIGVPKEIKNNENRVALTPAGVHALVLHGHDVLVLKSAGEGSGIADEQYVQAGARIILKVADLFEQSDLIVKVKEPLAEEYDLFKEGQALFTYLHLAPNIPLTEALLRKKIAGIAYETVQLADGTLPLLIPMSEVAGRMSIQVAAMLQQSYYGGGGMLLGGVPGVAPAHVVIIGGGIVGSNAAKIAVGMGANVTILDINQRRLAEIDTLYNGRINTIMSNYYSLAQMTAKADVLIGAVLVPGARAPKTVTEEMVRGMKKGAVIVDVAIDQGGTVETIDRITTHDNPSYTKHGVLHYSVANMPGAVPHTSTWALTGVTLPYLLKIADQGVEVSMKASKPLCLGLNTYKGNITYKAIADAMGKEYVPAEEVL